MSCGDDIVGEVLRGSYDMEPGDLVAVVADAVGKHLGAGGVSILLVDYAQRVLIPLPGSADADVLRVEGTLAGRAFITGELTEVADLDSVRLWVPVVDGSERLGVMALEVAGVVDDELRAAVVDVATVTAQLVQTRDAYTDIYERTARQQEMTLSAELLWAMLPPLTFSTPRAAVSGILEPIYAIGGDAFDYGFNGDRVDVAVIDAMGHGTDAVVPAVVALAGLRRARRRDRDLVEVYREADAAVREHVGGDAFVTAQLAELDAATGVLRWINAGHPQPLLVRDGHVSTLDGCEPSLPLGLVARWTPWAR